VKREERNFNQPTEKSVAARRVCEIYYIWLDYAKSRGRGLILAPLFWAIQSIYRNQTNVNLMEVSNRIEIDIPKKRCENEPPRSLVLCTDQVELDSARLSSRHVRTAIYLEVARRLTSAVSRPGIAASAIIMYRIRRHKA
jgi:hypothetical protein